MPRLTFLLSILLFSISACAQTTSWAATVARFVTDYERLEVPYLRLAYVDNLELIPSSTDLARQAEVFARLRADLELADRGTLTTQQQLDYDLLWYQLELNEERLALEKQWAQAPPTIMAGQSLAQFENGKAWYIYLLKRWLDKSVSPEELYEFGLTEIAKVQARMRDVQQRSGLDSLAFQNFINSKVFDIENVDTLQADFLALRERMEKSLGFYFPGISDVPPVDIVRNQDEAMAQVPGFYNQNTFYYNVFDRPFNRREKVWLFLHEALPGHHYERNYSRSLPRSAVQELFTYPAYAEGWAAYVEEIGYEIGAYTDIYDELGKWEWDIIRSVRVPLDIGLNYYGWSDDEALSFWQQYIPGKDDIAAREIARMKRWPCQVITYKYGADKILQWKAARDTDPAFHLLDFHTALLRHGPLPYSLLEARLK